MVTQVRCTRLCADFEMFSEHTEPPQQLAYPALAAAAGAISITLQATVRQPAVLACALAAFALAMPTALSAGLLAWSFAELLAPVVSRLPVHAAGASCARCLRPRALLGALIVWCLASYFCFASALTSHLPMALRLAAFVTNADLIRLGPLLVPYTTTAFLAAIAATAAHMRARSVPTLWAHLIATADTRQSSHPGGREQSGAQPAATQADARTPFERRAHRSLSLDEAPTLRRTSAASNVAARATVSVLFTVHTLAYALIPAGWLSLGMLHVCIAGSVYAAGPAAGWLVAVLAPAKRAGLALPRPSAHWRMRLYAAVHTVAALVLFLVQPWLPRWVPLVVIGDDWVSLRVHVAPILAMFLLATAHAALGTYLHSTVGSIKPPRQRRESPESERNASQPDQEADVRVPLLADQQGTGDVSTADTLRIERQWQPVLRFAGLAAVQAGVCRCLMPCS